MPGVALLISCAPRARLRSVKVGGIRTSDDDELGAVASTVAEGCSALPSVPMTSWPPCRRTGELGPRAAPGPRRSRHAWELRGERCRCRLRFGCAACRPARQRGSTSPARPRAGARDAPPTPLSTTDTTSWPLCRAALSTTSGGARAAPRPWRPSSQAVKCRGRLDVAVAAGRTCVTSTGAVPCSRDPAARTRGWRRAAPAAARARRAARSSSIATVISATALQRLRHLPARRVRGRAERAAGRVLIEHERAAGRRRAGRARSAGAPRPRQRLFANPRGLHLGAADGAARPAARAISIASPPASTSCRSSAGCVLTCRRCAAPVRAGWPPRSIEYALPPVVGRGPQRASLARRHRAGSRGGRSAARASDPTPARAAALRRPPVPRGRRAGRRGSPSCDAARRSEPG